MIRPFARRIAPLVCLLAAACASAAPNPAESGDPSPWKPPASAKPATSTATPANTASNAAAASGAPSTANGGASSTGGESAAPAGTSATSAAPSNATSTNAATNDDFPTLVQRIPVAHVAGRPVYLNELLKQWLYTDSMRVLRQLEDLAVARLVLAEADRLGVRLDPDMVAVAFEREMKKLEDGLQASEKFKGMSFDRYVERTLGLDPIRYREHLRDESLRSLLGQRVVRAFLLQSERAEVSAIVVEGEDKLKLVQDELAAGKSFDEVARAHSSDKTSAEKGGRLPPLLRSESPASRLAFATEVGGIGGPVEQAGAWLLLKVDARPTALAGLWSELAPAVEKSLVDEKITDQELTQWRDAMLRRYDVELTPFLELAGEPKR